MIEPAGEQSVANKRSSVSIFRLFGYAVGEGAVSITVNGISNFAMLFYTQVLGLGATYAGIALSVTVLWDAITDPVMGHITDNTRSRFGRRHPFMLWGGLALALSFFMLWVLPGRFSTAQAIFWSVLVINLIVHTAVTVFVVPYTALGFEICSEYVDRSRLQGIRYFLNQVTNLVFGAFAWTMFFRDGVADDGSRIDGTLIYGNYLTMGIVLSAVTFVMILLCIFATRTYAADNRRQHVEGNSVKAFLADIANIARDRLAWYVFGFFGIAQLAMLLTSQMQMFTYVHYMELSDTQKTGVHGAGMLAFAIGSICLSRIVRRFDKKVTGYIGMAISSFGSLALFVVFTGGLVDPLLRIEFAGRMLPLAAILFGIFQGRWWGGCGILLPLAISMIADVSEINQKRTGLLKNGSYSAAFSFFLKAATSFGLLITGWLVSRAGIVSGAEAQTAEAARNVAVMTFLSGPLIVFFSFLILRKYPVDKTYMDRLKAGQISFE